MVDRLQAICAGNFLFQWGSYGTGIGQLYKPSGIAIDNSGNVFVSDTYNNRIQEFTSAGSFATQWGTSGTGNGQFQYPYGLAIDGSGNFYVVDQNNSRIQKFSSGGSYLAQWGSSGTGNGQFLYPWGIAINGSGNIYVTDQNRVQEFTAGGTYLTQWGTLGTGNGQFNSTIGIAIDASANVYVVDSNNNRIQEFTSAGSYITQWGSQGSGNGQFQYPDAISLDGSGNVYVSDNSGHVQEFTSAGGFLAKWGSYGSGSGQIGYPYGLALDSSGNVFVADESNNRIEEFGCSLLTPSPSPAWTPTRSPTFTDSPTSGFSYTISPTESASPTPTSTATPTPTVTSSATPFVQGTETAAAHTLTVQASVTPPTSLVNGGFEFGSVQDWNWHTMAPPYLTDSDPVPQIVTYSHSGSYAILLGVSPTTGSEPNGFSGIYQEVLVPNTACNPTLSFWYLPDTTEPDPSALADYQECVIMDPSGNILATPMQVCQDSSGGWRYFSYDMSAFIGQAVVIGLRVYEDGYGDVSSMVVDDVQLSGVCTPTMSPTWSPSPSVTVTISWTPSLTPSASQSPTMTVTDCPACLSWTPSPTVTDTPTFLPTPTLSGAGCAANRLVKWGHYGSGNGEFDFQDIYGGGIAMDSFKNLYVFDSGNFRIQKLTWWGNYITQWGSQGTGDGQFGDLTYSSLAIGPDGNVYVLDSGNNRVEVFTSTGTYLWQWGTTGTGNGQFNFPTSLTVDSSGAVYVYDTRIQKFTSNGSYVAQWPTAIFIAQLATDQSGSIYAFGTDGGSFSGVVKYDSSGNTLAQWTTGTYGINDPVAGAIDKYGNVFAVGYDWFIYEFDSVGNPLQKFEWGLSQSIICDDDNLYVTDLYDSVDSFGCAWGTLTQTPTNTPTRTVSPLLSPTTTPTASPTFSVSPSPTMNLTPGGVTSSIVADFEGGTLTSNFGGSLGNVFTNGSTISEDLLTGCPYGSTAHCCHAHGTCMHLSIDQWVMDFISGGGPVDLTQWSTGHALTFSFNSLTPGVTYQICLKSAVDSSNPYCATFTPTTTGWQDITVYFPDVNASSADLQLSQNPVVPTASWSTCLQNATGISIGPLASSTIDQNFDFSVDDIRFSNSARTNNYLAVADALGVDLTTVQDAYGLGLDEYLTWLVIRISKKCGCHPHDILALRATLSWGDICLKYGLTWSSVIADVDNRTGAAGLTPMEPNSDQSQRSCVNDGVSPTPTPQPVVPFSTVTLQPTPGACS
jgi:sugar lactone lactonase YvrE